MGCRDSRILRCPLVEIAVETQSPIAQDGLTMRLGVIRMKSRRGVAPLLAELFLVVASLVSSLVLNGYLFGELGSFTPPAEVQ